MAWVFWALQVERQLPCIKLRWDAAELNVAVATCEPYPARVEAQNLRSVHVTAVWDKLICHPGPNTLN